MTREELTFYRKELVKIAKAEFKLNNSDISQIFSFGITKEGVRKVLLKNK